MSTKPVFEKIEKIQRSYVLLCATCDSYANDTGSYCDHYWQKSIYFATM